MTHSGRIGRALATAALAAGVAATAIVTAAPADAATKSCPPLPKVGFCASVTAIAKGSYLAQHKSPSYASGVYSAPKLHNGDKLRLDCWTTGSADADGHGDHYWFFSWQWDPAKNLYYGGYVNDWYVTSGSPATWKKKVTAC